MTDISLRNYAHVGDAVWELFVREYTINKTPNIKQLHKLTTSYVNMKFQAEMLGRIDSELTEEEKELARRARNCQIPVARRNNQHEYRKSTSFEALIGYWYLNNKSRLNKIFEIIKLEYFI